MGVGRRKSPGPVGFTGRGFAVARAPRGAVVPHCYGTGGTTSDRSRWCGITISSGF